MFDVSFSELLVIALVALIVIGPERLPRVARTLGHLFGRLQRYVNEVKADIQREMELDELRRFKSSVEDAAREMETAVHSEMRAAGSELESLAQIADPQTPAAPTAPPAEQQLELSLEPAARSETAGREKSAA